MAEAKVTHPADPTTSLSSQSTFSVTPIACLSDNYAYLIVAPRADGTRVCAVVDAVNPDRVIAAVVAAGLQSTDILYCLTTHHHADHAGGNVELAARVGSDMTVIGGRGDPVAGATKWVDNNDVLPLGTATIKVIHVPCHTRGHVAYLVTSTTDDKHVALFSGDTLFNCGCGRFFEGIASEMYDNLCVKFAALPAHTLVYSGHEYMVSNLLFATHVEPDNVGLTHKLKWAQSQREKGLPTVPTTIAEELGLNPFMRVSQPSVAAYAKRDATKPIEVMAELRKIKDTWKPPAAAPATLAAPATAAAL